MPVRQRRDSSSSDEAALRSAKDRECPFCHQAFTSSSLGRHLDLFIRPNNPKPPDGVHLVDEIRRIRGRITRRQPKGLKKNGTQTPPSPIENARFVNAMDWRATGVINSVGDEPVLPDQSLEEQIETGRAAESALRDLVDNIKAAQTIHRPLDDLSSLSFPGLCLAILPAPRSLFSTTPFADSDSWDLSPPGKAQRAAVEKELLKRKENIEIDASFDRWMAMSAENRTHVWLLEVLRSWTRAKKAQDDLQSQLYHAKQRIAHLETEYEYLSRCQLPREKLLSVPETIPIDLQKLDAERLLDKWRDAIKNAARPRKARPTQTSMRRDDPTAPTLVSSMIIQGSVFGIGGPMERSEDNPVMPED